MAYKNAIHKLSLPLALIFALVTCSGCYSTRRIQPIDVQQKPELLKKEADRSTYTVFKTSGKAEKGIDSLKLEENNLIAEIKNKQESNVEKIPLSDVKRIRKNLS